MRPDEFQLMASILKKRSGLSLSDDKAYLIESRLLPIARAHGLKDVSDLCQAVRAGAKEDLLVDITEAMTTNESSFFRDIKPYDCLRQKIFPMLMAQKSSQRQIRIWSAAASTGQEAYSISICIQEDMHKMQGWQFEIAASDIARKVIDKAIKGNYSQFEAQRGLPIQMLVKYFISNPDTSWQIKDQIRKMVQFRVHNLLDEYHALGRFDIIFCRNVLIYFDESIKAQITEKMSRTLSPGGILVIGASETLIDPKGLFVSYDELRGAYRLKG